LILVRNCNKQLICYRVCNVTPSIPLAVLRPGAVAEINQIVGTTEQVRRLEELGLRSGSVLEMVRSGTTCIVRVGDSKLCIRNDAGLQVLVAPRMSA
jgi:ferrous iron transport protein A